MEMCNRHNCNSVKGTMDTDRFWQWALTNLAAAASLSPPSGWPALLLDMATPQQRCPKPCVPTSQQLACSSSQPATANGLVSQESGVIRRLWNRARSHTPFFWHRLGSSNLHHRGRRKTARGGKNLLNHHSCFLREHASVSNIAFVTCHHTLVSP